MSSLFDDFKGWQIGVITAHKQFQESVGRYASTLKSLKSGNLDTTFYIYDGTEKEKKHPAVSARKEGRNDGHKFSKRNYEEKKSNRGKKINKPEKEYY